MGNNNEIRKRIETYRTVLLVVVWIAGITGMIRYRQTLDAIHIRFICKE